MNDTNITPRQTAIINLLAEGLDTGAKLLAGLKPTQLISKATLMRDLSDLKKGGLIRTEGKGKAIRYFSLVSPLLRPIDLDGYFKDGSVLRKAGPIEFNFAVFNSLKEKEIFTPQN